MTLNGTIFVQAINFLFAYFIIDRLLLRKSVAIIQQERIEQENLMTAIQEERTHVLENELQKKNEWEDFRQQFEKKSPKIIEKPSIKKFEEKIKPAEKPTKGEIEQLANKLKDILIKKVTHVGN